MLRAIDRNLMRIYPGALMLIRNYGLFWRRNIIGEEWPRSGELLGVGVRKKRQKTVDFSTQRGIYALYDDNFQLIYVGQAGKGKRRLYQRLRTHTRNNLSERWSRFSWFGVLPVSAPEETGQPPRLIEGDDAITVTQLDVLNHIEAVLIMAGEPIRNAKGGIFGPAVTHYRQYQPGSQIDENDADVDDE